MAVISDFCLACNQHEDGWILSCLRIGCGEGAHFCAAPVSLLWIPLLVPSGVPRVRFGGGHCLLFMSASGKPLTHIYSKLAGWPLILGRLALFLPCLSRPVSSERTAGIGCEVYGSLNQLHGDRKVRKSLTTAGDLRGRVKHPVEVGRRSFRVDGVSSISQGDEHSVYLASDAAFYVVAVIPSGFCSHEFSG